MNKIQSSICANQIFIYWMKMAMVMILAGFGEKDLIVFAIHDMEHDYENDRRNFDPGLALHSRECISEFLYLCNF